MIWAMALEQETAFYESHKADILRDHAGQFVLIKGDHLIGAFTTAAQAYEASVRRFGNQPVLIRQAIPEDPQANFFALQFGLLSAHS